MKKPIIRQRRFCRPFLAKDDKSVLPIEALDQVSCFETLRAYDGRIFHCREHLERLLDSCRAIGSPPEVSLKEIEAWLKECLKQCRLRNALLRLAVHGSDHLVLILRKFKGHPADWALRGVALKTTVRRRFDFKAQDPQIKASQFMNGVLAALDESGPRAHELLFFGPLGTVAEGSVSNVFIVRDKQWFGGAHHKLLTPAVSSGILRGVTRAVVIDLAKRIGLEVVETLLTRHEFYNARECFMTNTSSEVLPVTSIDGRNIGAGVPGLITRRLMKEFKKMIP